MRHDENFVYEYLSGVVDGSIVAVVVDPGAVAAVDVLAALIAVVAVVVVNLIWFAGKIQTESALLPSPVCRRKESSLFW